MGSIFQSIINGAPNLVFDSIKPFMLKDAYQKIRTEVDTNIAKVAGDFRFPNSITPLDMAIAELRKKVRDMGYDPFILKDYNHTIGLFSMKLQNTWISGASSFYRVGDVVVSMDNNTLQLRTWQSCCRRTTNTYSNHSERSYRTAGRHTRNSWINAMECISW